MEKKLVPYNLYLYAEQVDRLKKVAKERKASTLVRDAVYMALDGKDPYAAGYNRGLADALKELRDLKELKMLLSINGKSLDKVMTDKIAELKK